MNMVGKFVGLFTCGLMIPLIEYAPQGSIVEEMGKTGAQGILAIIVGALAWAIVKKDKQVQKQSDAHQKRMEEIAAQHAAEYKELAEKSTSALTANAEASKAQTTATGELKEAVYSLKGSVEKSNTTNATIVRMLSESEETADEEEPDTLASSGGSGDGTS